MKNKSLIINVFSFFSVIMLSSLFLFQTRCNSNSSSKNDTVNLDKSVNKTDKAYAKAKKIFFSLPSPSETASILEMAGLKYSPEFLNSPNNASNYIGNKSMALNLGIFSADLSYVSVYEQSQATVNYMSACKELADGLHITQAIDDSVLIKIKSNMNNKEKVLTIVSETFLNSNAYLQENQRSEIAAMMMVGGWMEMLYIAINLSEKSKNKNEDVMNRIVEQRMSMEDLLGLLELYRENKEVSSLIADMENLKSTFEKMDESISPVHFKELCDKVKKIRSSYVQ